jgi:hypothetical protein
MVWTIHHGHRLLPEGRCGDALTDRIGSSLGSYAPSTVEPSASFEGPICQIPLLGQPTRLNHNAETVSSLSYACKVLTSYKINIISKR